MWCIIAKREEKDSTSLVRFDSGNRAVQGKAEQEHGGTGGLVEKS